MDDLTDDQFATLMDAVELARSACVRRLSFLRAGLIAIGHAECDIGPALAYWARHEYPCA